MKIMFSAEDLAGVMDTLLGMHTTWGRCQGSGGWREGDNANACFQAYQRI